MTPALASPAPPRRHRPARPDDRARWPELLRLVLTRPMGGNAIARAARRGDRHEAAESGEIRRALDAMQALGLVARTDAGWLAASAGRIWFAQWLAGEDGDDAPGGPAGHAAFDPDFDDDDLDDDEEC